MQNQEKIPLGTGHAAAFYRQGLGELRNALYPESNIAQPQAEYGIYDTKLPSEIAEERRPDLTPGESIHSTPSMLDNTISRNTPSVNQTRDMHLVHGSPED